MTPSVQALCPGAFFPAPQNPVKEQLRGLQPDKLLQTLEIIALGNAADPKSAAEEALVDIGFWNADAVLELKSKSLHLENNKVKKPKGASRFGM